MHSSAAIFPHPPLDFPHPTATALLRSHARLRRLHRVNRQVRPRESRSLGLSVLLTALGDALHDAVVLDVVGVVGLDVRRQPVESPLKRLLAAGVHHARLYRSVSHCPRKMHK